ncbi:hypothetical protein [Corynebacterium callunae]|uniref:hypothetical protein n=1 Tax=Corynebacterium callunae TaxID=1721 RepID=UPI001FFF72AB|nr:hypothetical protein [Corynebacterium callunae]MCK2200522.1 hypothetical protein [Corynebacterium callunae]
MNIKEWLTTLPGSPSVSQAADHAEVSKATFLRHEKKGETTAEYAIKIARAYNINEVQALLDLGFIEEAAVLEIAVDNALGFAKNSQLWVEISKRADPEARRLFRAEGNPGVIDLDDDTIAIEDDAQVFNFPIPDQEEEFEPERYVAKRKRSEPAEGDDDYGSGA